MEEQIGRYKILSLLGKGGMGSVYKAEDPSIGRIVAIKTISMDQIDVPSVRREFKKRFFQEAKICGKMSHPGVLGIHDIGEQDGMPFIATEYIEGVTLSRYVSENELSGTEICDIVEQIAQALDYAHECGIIHRDVKPQNIMVNKEGKTKVLDFGLAKLAEAEMTHLTRPGDFIGSPSYSSPEQVKGAPIDRRSDIFSLSVTAYELISGKRPFRGDSINAVLFKIISGEAAPIKLPNLPAEGQTVLNQIFRKALNKEPDSRFQTCQELSLALRAVLQDGDYSQTYFLDLEDEEATVAATVGVGGNPSGNFKTQWHNPSQPEQTEATRAEPGRDRHLRAADTEQEEKKGISSMLMGGVLVLLLLIIPIAWWMGRKDTEALPPPQSAIPTRETNEPGQDNTPKTAEQDSEGMSAAVTPESEPDPEREEPSEPVVANPVVDQSQPEVKAPVIPLLFSDPKFKAYLVASFDEDGDGEVSRSEALTVTQINTPGQPGQKGRISDLTGIGYFTNLKTLNSAFQSLTSLPPLPASLESLNVSGNRITALPILPASLKNLNCSQNRIFELESLPKSLTELNCSENKLSKLPGLPSGLTVLNCSGNQLGAVPKIPTSLKTLDLRGNNLTREHCPQLTELTLSKLDYSPQRGAGPLDCVRLERERLANARKLGPVIENFEEDLKSGNLDAARKHFEELAGLKADTEQRLIALMALEYEALQKDWQTVRFYSENMIKRLERAALSGDARSQFSQGLFFEKQEKENYFDAKKWYLKAAVQDFAPAIYRLGFLYLDGRGVPTNHQKAAEFFFRAAALDHAKSKYQIGEMYRTGNGLDKSAPEALKWFSQAAEDNYPPAQESLGYMYLEGDGVDISRKERRRIAAYWFCRAATQGNGQAKMRLREVKKKLEDCTQIIKEFEEK